jgi:hypothetical protein
MEQFIKNILDGKKSKTSLIDQLYRRPTKDENGDNPTFPKIDPNYLQQIDLLYLPNDNGMKYCLVVVDQGSRYLGAIALEDRTVNDVIKGLKGLYKSSKYLKKPVNIVSDQGSEFLGSFDSELHKMGINYHKIVKSGRHRSVSLAERKNQTIGKIISKILTQVQLTSGNASSKWVSYLPIIVDSINEKIDEQNKKIKPQKLEDVKPITSNPDHKIDLLNEGDEVRVALDNPIDVNGKSLNGKFRTGDIRWNPKIRTVKYMYMKPNEPIMYFLDGNHGNLKIETVGYTRNQLQKVSTREKDIQIQQPLFENENNRHEIQHIRDRGVNELDQIMYLVKFKGIRKAVWMERSKLVQDLGKSYMDKLDKKFKEVDQ